MRVPVVGTVFPQAAAHCQKTRNEQSDGGEISESVRIPVHLGAGLHVLQEKHDENEHGQVAEHQKDVSDPGPFVIAIPKIFLREEVQQRRAQETEVK